MRIRKLQVAPPTAVALLAIASLGPGAAWADQPTSRSAAALLDALPLRLIGPSSPSGRVWNVIGIPGSPKTFYVCTCQGGVWKTTNFGTTLSPVFDEENGASCGAVAIAPSNPDHIWVGTGEPAARQSVGLGYGVFKSTDGGRSWQHLGLESTEEVAAIVIDPTDPDTVLVAATGHLWGRNAERGVYKTTDGGGTWRRVLFVDDMTGAIDLVADPHDARVLYAAMWQRMRSGGSQMRESGPGSGLYKSVDGGEHWRHLDVGLPDDDLSKITIAPAHNTPGLIYAFVMSGEPRRPGRTSDTGGIFRSDNAGESWQRVSPKLASRTYYTHLKIDPGNDDRLWILDLRLWRSDDGGRTWQEHNSEHVHADLHGLWIDPADPDRLVLGGDGGVSVSLDGGDTWVQTVLPIGQFYEVNADDQDPYRVYGGMQDTATWAGPSRTYDVEGITAHDWIKLRATGDGMAVQADPRNANVIYMAQNNGNTSRLDLRTWIRTELQPTQARAAELGLGALRWDWTPPMVLDLDDPDVLYLGANHLFRCHILGVRSDGEVDHRCESVSDDLTAQQDEPFAAVGEGYHSYGALFSIAQSPVDHDVLWTGADDGPIHVSTDGGETWSRVDRNLPPGSPTLGVVAEIEPSRTSAGTAYVALDLHYRDINRPFLYRTIDYGASWEDITANLPSWGVTYVIREDPHNPRVLYVGTESGLFVSLDQGARWVRWRSNFPSTAVRSLVVQERERELVIGTFGRGIWIADVAPVQQLEAALAASAFLFDVKPAVAYNLRYTYGTTIEELNGDTFFRGTNPPYGAIVTYSLDVDLPGDVRLTVSDSTGAIVRHLAGPGTAGIHQVTWDLEPEGDRPTQSESGHRLTSSARQRRHRAAPGRYRVTLGAGGRSHAQEIVVRAEPAAVRWVLPRK